MFALSLFSNDTPSDEASSQNSSEDPVSIVSDGAKIEGNLEFSAVNLRIEGTVHGDINTDGRVVVSEGAEVQGTIDAHTIRLAGQVEGHLRAEDELVLCPSSEVHATLKADILEIQPGADFTGEVPNGEQSIEESPKSPVLDQNGADLSTAVNRQEKSNAEVDSQE
jgi:cytoskeletal protein CcmA (bactofilin family)